MRQHSYSKSSEPNKLDIESYQFKVTVVLGALGQVSLADMGTFSPSRNMLPSTPTKATKLRDSMWEQ